MIEQLKWNRLFCSTATTNVDMVHWLLVAHSLHHAFKRSQFVHINIWAQLYWSYGINRSIDYWVNKARSNCLWSHLVSFEASKVAHPWRDNEWFIPFAYEYISCLWAILCALRFCVDNPSKIVSHCFWIWMCMRCSTQKNKRAINVINKPSIIFPLVFTMKSMRLVIRFQSCYSAGFLFFAW